MRQFRLLVLIAGVALTYLLASCGEERNIGRKLDPMLLEYCIDNGPWGANCDVNGDGKISAKEVAELKTINVGTFNRQYKGKIESLRGLKYFKSLVVLDFSENNVKKVDLSELHNLEALSCYSNQLTSINLKGLTKLVDINISGNKIDKIELASQSKLQYLHVSDCNMREIDLSVQEELNSFHGWGNRFKKLVFRNNTAIQVIDCHNNSGLSMIDISRCDRDLLHIFNCMDNESLKIVYVWKGFSMESIPITWEYTTDKVFSEAVQ